MSREELGSLLRLLVDTGRITAEQAAEMVVRFDLGELATADLPVPLRDMPGRLTPVELAFAMRSVAVRLTPKQAEPFLAAATRPVTQETPSEVKQFLRERLRNHFRQNYDNTIAGYTHALADGGDVAFWQRKMSLEQRAYIARMTTAGLGRPLTTAEIDRVSQTAIAQQGYLYKFAGEISARRAVGKPHSEAYLQARARQYGGEGWAAWFVGNETVAAHGDGYVARYVAVDDQQTCGPCLDAQNGSPYLPSSGPLPGQVCRGRGLCRCRREVYFDMDAWQRLSGVAPAPTVAPVEPPIVPEPAAVAREAVAPVEQAATYRPVTTLEEAHTWAFENAINDQSRQFYQEDLAAGLKPELPVDYAGVDLDVANEVNRALNDSIARGVPKLSAIKSAPSREGYLMAMNNSGELLINTRKVSGLDSFIDVPREKVRQTAQEIISLTDPANTSAKEKRFYDAAVETLKFPRFGIDDSPYGVVTHELGHHLDNNKYRITGLDKTDTRADRDRKQEFGDSVIKAVDKMDTPEYRYRLSEYPFTFAPQSDLLTRRKEIFAESFASYMEGERNVVHPDLIAIFERLLQ